jgi:YggT family protein
MGGILGPIVEALYYLLEFYKWVIIVAALVSWVVAFGMINTYNRNAAMIIDFLYRITDPVLRPIRRFLPSFAVDISPVIAFLIIYVLQRWLVYALVYVYQW